MQKQLEQTAKKQYPAPHLPSFCKKTGQQNVL
jgi:hypothetical protein